MPSTKAARKPNLAPAAPPTVEQLAAEVERLRARTHELQERADAAWSRFYREYKEAIDVKHLYETWVARGRAWAQNRNPSEPGFISDQTASLLGAALERARELEVFAKARDADAANRDAWMRVWHDKFFTLNPALRAVLDCGTLDDAKAVARKALDASASITM